MSQLLKSIYRDLRNNEWVIEKCVTPKKRGEWICWRAECVALKKHFREKQKGILLTTIDTFASTLSPQATTATPQQPNNTLLDDVRLALWSVKRSFSGAKEVYLTKHQKEAANACIELLSRYPELAKKK